MIYLQLFISFFQIGLFSIGGGYACMPLIQNQIVDIHNWLSMSEFVDVVTISQMTPGPIAVNSATFVGIQIGGFLGAVVATLGCILPSVIIVITLSYIYYKYRGISVVQGVLDGLRPAVVAMISSAGLSILVLSLLGETPLPFHFKNVDVIAVCLFALSLFVLRKWKLNPIHVMLGSGVLGLIVYSITGLGIS